MKIVGHRGAKGLAPENTIAALKTALACKVDEIEFDVCVTKDGVAVLAHPFISSAKFSQLLARHSYAELKKRHPDLATLSEAIEAINRKVPALIEVKPGVSTRPVIKVINQFLSRGWQEQDFLLASFSRSVLLELNEALPRIKKVVNERWSGIRATRRARELGTDRLNINSFVLWSGFIRAMKRRGYKLYAYPLNNPDKAKAWARQGLAGAITDYPDRFSKTK